MFVPCPVCLTAEVIETWEHSGQTQTESLFICSYLNWCMTPPANRKDSFWKSALLFTILKAVDSSSRVMKWTSSVFLPVQKSGIGLGEGGWWKRPKHLPTGTGVHCHIGVDFKDHVLVFVEEEDAEGRHLLRYTAGLWDARDHPDRPHDALDGGVVWRFQWLYKGKKRSEPLTAKVCFVINQ